MLDLVVIGATVLGALATLGGTSIGDRGYQQQSALRRLSVEVDAYLEPASRAHLLIVVRNNGDEAVRVSRLKVVKPDAARFQKERGETATAASFSRSTSLWRQRAMTRRPICPREQSMRFS